MTKPLSTIGRMLAANARNEARRDAWLNPKNQIVRRVRSEMMALDRIGDEARLRWEAENAPVRLPIGAGHGDVHPQRAAAIRDLMIECGWSDDPRDPIQPTQTLDELRDALSAETRERLAQAEAELAEFEEEFRRSTLEAP